MNEIDKAFITKHQERFYKILVEIRRQNDLFPLMGCISPKLKEQAEWKEALGRLRAELRTRTTMKGS